MAYPVAADDNVQWSDETFTLREVVTKVGLPTMVKVSEGLYSDNEAETFSYGDLLKLEFVKSIRKVSANLIDVGNGGSLINLEKSLRNPKKYDKPSKDILIPLGYKGLVELIKPLRQLYTVEQLMDEFPSNIRTETALFGDEKETPIQLPPGVYLQVDRITPNKEGIVCKHKKKEIIIYKEQKGKFSIIENERTYTLEEVVECFQLPQFVRFVDTDFASVQTSNLDEAIENIKHFSGILKLTREVIQNVVVGHHKPSTDAMCRGQSSVHSLALLPLDSISQQMIVFNVPIYSDLDEYRLVMARNFSQDVDMSSIEGVLYLEFAKDPKVHLFRTDSKVEQTTGLPERKNAKDHRTQIHTDSASFKPTDKVVGDEKSLTDSADPSMEEKEYDYPDVSLLLNQKKREKVQCSDKLSADDVIHHDQISDGKEWFADNGNHMQQTEGKFFQGKRKQQLPLPEDNDSGTTQGPEYDYEDMACIQPPRPVPRARSKLNSIGGKKQRSVASVTPSVSSHRSHVTATSLNPQEPVSEDPFGTTKRFSELTVEEICKCFKSCGLTEVAKVCEREMLDGAFLSELSVDELERELFRLTPIQVKKLERIKMGWRPKTEKFKSKSLDLN